MKHEGLNRIFQNARQILSQTAFDDGARGEKSAVAHPQLFKLRVRQVANPPKFIPGPNGGEARDGPGGTGRREPHPEHQPRTDPIPHGFDDRGTA